MDYFALIEGTELVAILVAFGGILVGFYAFAQKQMKEARDERIEEREAFTKALDRQSKAVEGLRKPINDSNEIGKELKQFLVNLNGSLVKTVHDKQSKAKE